MLATLLGQALGWYAHGDRAGFLASVGGAVVVLIAYEAIKPRTAAPARTALNAPGDRPPR